MCIRDSYDTVFACELIVSIDRYGRMFSDTKRSMRKRCHKGHQKYEDCEWHEKASYTLEFRSGQCFQTFQLNKGIVCMFPINNFVLFNLKTACVSVYS